MRITIIRSMPNFSMDVYADSIISGLKTVRPNWQITELSPRPIDRNSRSFKLRTQKFKERFWSFPHRVKQQISDIYHIIDHSEAHIINWLKNTKTPTIVTCHDLINFFYRDNLQGSVKIPLLSNSLWQYSVKAMQKSDHIIAVSHTTAKDTANILKINPHQISVVGNMVDQIYRKLPNQEIRDFRQKLGISPDTYCLINVGANHPRKNLMTILRALKIMVEKELPIQLWKVGADFNDEQKQFIQNHQLDKHIHHFGQPDKLQLLQLYNAADILLAPSIHEGFGITLIEAMACGIPVITSNISAMPEVVGSAGLLVPPTDVNAIVSAVITLMHNPDDYQKLVLEGEARIKLFSREIIGERLAQIYENIAS